MSIAKPHKGLRIGVQALIWCALLWFVVQALEGLPDKFQVATFVKEGAVPAVLAFAGCFVLALFIRALRFGYLIRRGTQIGWYDILTAFPWLFMLGAVTPFRLGDMARANWAQRKGGSGAQTIGLWIAERVTDMLCLVLLALLAVALSPGTEMYRGFLWLLACGIGAIYLLLSCSPVILDMLPLGRLRHLLSAFSYMHQPKVHAAVLAFTVSIWMVMVAGFWSGLSLAVGRSVPLELAVLCLSLVNLAALLSAAPGNVGSFQAAAIFAMGLYGIASDTALLVSSALQLGGLGVTLLAGIVCRGIMMMPLSHHEGSKGF